MAAMPGTVGIDCPRGCAEKIECTLHAETATPKPGAKSVNVRLTVPDLADKMAEHYQVHHARIDLAQAAVVTSINTLGAALVGSGYAPITTSPIPDDEMAHVISATDAATQCEPRALVFVVARRVDMAKVIASGFSDKRVIAMSPRSVREGAGRGFCGVTNIFVDDSAWPLDSDVLDALTPCLAPDGQVSRLD
jgi:hypothetical protein